MTELLPLMSYCFVMSVTPGPNNVMLATTGANFGYRGALPVILGIQVGIFVQTMLMCVGLGSVLIAYPMTQQLMRIAGALYLMFLAWKLAAASVAGSSAPRAVSFAQAVLFQALNPKSWLKAVTMASVFMPSQSNMLASALLLSVIGTVVGMPCNTMWALFGVSIRNVLKAPRNQRIFNLVMGAILLVLSVMFLR
ncbi:LysE family translocator [Herbaspirillum sp. C7C8]|uniref:LysE family translocator n=1 Tax=Herbaspirillum sp. C7C8 TaxID=2736665 RepID=UPI001F5162A9|nr:LysE family translocator [Herbaspirillum sp. C7C8]MCI1003279.1 LysE family translocator [Herbaspirillum sp. C7C8]